MEAKYIAQGLRNAWIEEKNKGTQSCGVVPLMSYLKFNYIERYVKLCNRLSITPVSFGQWLRRPLETV